MRIPVGFFVFVSIFSYTNGYPDGGPCRVVDSMKPGHGRQGNGPSPYSLQILDSRRSKANQIDAGQKYIVEITAVETLKGIALQARDQSNTRRGEFPLDGQEGSIACVKPMCPNDKSAITHGSVDCDSRSRCTAASPCKIQLSWVAPRSADTSIQFKFTGVKKYSEWYQLSTPSINYKGGAPEANAANRRRAAENNDDSKGNDDNFNPWGTGYSGK